jgi:hypothetical protein
MVQFLRRGTTFNLAGARKTLHKRRCKAGLSSKKLTDKDLLQHLEEGQGYLGHKSVLEHRLKKSWQIHRDDGACFRILDAELVAVTNTADNTVLTILTKEIAQKRIPFDLGLTFEVYRTSLISQSLTNQGGKQPPKAEP